MKKNGYKNYTVFFCSGTFSIHGKCRVTFQLLEYMPTLEITRTMHVKKTSGNYVLIIIQVLSHELGVDISFSSKTMTCNNVTIYMQPTTCTREDACNVEDELFVSDDTDWIAKIQFFTSWLHVMISSYLLFYFHPPSNAFQGYFTDSWNTGPRYYTWKEY